MTEGEKAKRLQLRKKPKQERSIQRLDAIFAAATRLITAKGIADLKMTEIAAEAGIPIGSLYQFFPEKAAIVRALHDDFTSRFETGTRISFASAKSIEEVADMIDRGIDRFYEIFGMEPVYLPVWLTAMSDPDLQSLNRAHIGRMTDTLKVIVEPLLPEGVEVDLEARLFQLVYMTGAVVRYALIVDEQTARRALDEWKRTVRLTLFAF